MADHYCSAIACWTYLPTREVVYDMLLYLRSHAERGRAGTGTLCMVQRQRRVVVLPGLRMREAATGVGGYGVWQCGNGSRGT